MNEGVTYTIKVVSTRPGEGGRELRTVLFRRASGGDSIEISAETDAPNLLAHLPELLDAAMVARRGPPASLGPRFAEESRLLRRLTAAPGRSPGEREEAYPSQP